MKKKFKQRHFLFVLKEIVKCSSNNRETWDDFQKTAYDHDKAHTKTQETIFFIQKKLKLSSFLLLKINCANKKFPKRQRHVICFLVHSFSMSINLKEMETIACKIIFEISFHELLIIISQVDKQTVSMNENRLSIQRYQFAILQST